MTLPRRSAGHFTSGYLISMHMRLGLSSSHVLSFNQTTEVPGQESAPARGPGCPGRAGPGAPTPGGGGWRRGRGGTAARPPPVLRGMAGGAARVLLAALLGTLPAAAERELRFRPPAEAPVRLFTEPELARYDGQQVGAGGRQSCGGGLGPPSLPGRFFKAAGPGWCGRGVEARAGGASWRRPAQPPALPPSLLLGALKPH